MSMATSLITPDFLQDEYAGMNPQGGKLMLSMSKVQEFYEEIREELAETGVIQVNLNDIPFGVNNRKLQQIKACVSKDYGQHFCIEKSGGWLTIDRRRAPVPDKKVRRTTYTRSCPAYVNR